MSSQERDDDDETTPHQPLLSSLVVRPTDSGGGGGSDYEPGEVRREPPPSYSRSDRFPDNQGYRTRAGSTSPVHRRNGNHRYSPEFDHSSGPPRNRGFGRGRDQGRYRDHSPPYGRGRDFGGRFAGRGLDAPGMGPGSFRGDGYPRTNPNVRPREGDWMCTDPSCNNLNFARREQCNKCHRPRYSTGASPRRGYPGPPLNMGRRFPGPPLDRSPGRAFNGYRSPPRGFARDGPRDFGIGGPPHLRHEGRFPRDRPNHLDDDFRERNRFDRAPPVDWGRERVLGDRKGGYDRRPQSPPLAPHRPPSRGGGGRWGDFDERERSRSPIRGGGAPPPSKDYRRDAYLERGRDDRRGMGRGAF